MKYIVSIEKDGSFKAEKLSGFCPPFDGETDTFQCEYWHVFQAELYHRLLNETPTKLREPIARENRNTKPA